MKKLIPILLTIILFSCEIEQVHDICFKVYEFEETQKSIKIGDCNPKNANNIEVRLYTGNDFIYISDYTLIDSVFTIPCKYNYDNGKIILSYYK